VIRARPALALARLSFEDATREPAYAIVVLAAAVANALAPALTMFGFSDDTNLLKDFGVSTTLLAGTLLAGLSSLPGAGGRGGEILLTRPVGRGLTASARFAGMTLALLLFALVSTSSLLLAARHGPPPRAGYPSDQPVLAFGLGGAALALISAGAMSRLRRRPFGATAVKLLAAALAAAVLASGFFDREWGPVPPLRGFDPVLVRASILAFLGAVIFGAVSLLLSAVLKGGAVFGLAAVFLAALIAPPGSFIDLVLPEIRAFSRGDVFYEAAPFLPWRHVALGAAHAILYSAALIALSAWLLEHEEASR
jgi:hypothetical protein